MKDRVSTLRMAGDTGEMTAFCEEQKIADMGTLVGALDARTGVSVLDSWL